MLDRILEKASERSAENSVQRENDYTKDGLLYCGNCNTAKQVKLTGRFGGIVSCVCRCELEKYEKQNQLRRQQEKELATVRLRNSGIHNPLMHRWTFENDNGSCVKLINTAKRYVNGWEDMKSKKIGLCFFGGVGTGKTYTAACIANALINKGNRVIMTDFSRIINAMQSFETKNKNAYIDNICNCDLLIIDDLGAERQSDYALEICEQVIDGRIKSGKPMILTTNIPLETLKNPTDLKYARMYSRILEMTVPVQSTGTDRRKTTHEENMKWAKAYFSAY
jgi:DNA replication protein DnaC